MPTFVCYRGPCDGLALTEEGAFSLQDALGRDWLCYPAKEVHPNAGMLAGELMHTQLRLAAGGHKGQGGGQMAIIGCADADALQRELGGFTNPVFPPLPDRRISRTALLALPRWARVVFACRCARQARGLYPAALVAVEGDYLAVYDDALNLAQRSAAEGRSAEGLLAALKRASDRCRAALATAEACGGGEGPPWAVQAWPAAACSAANAAAWGSRPEGGNGLAGEELAARSAYGAFELTWFAAAAEVGQPGRPGFAVTTTAGVTTGRPAVVAELEQDLLRLQQAAARADWTDETPMPPGFWGDDETGRSAGERQTEP